jgi:hypothetical protein
MRVVCGEGVSEILSGRSFWGFIRVLILVCVRAWRVHVWLIGCGIILTIVPGKCERSAFPREVNSA